ncbi:Leucyl aminopeptidase (aminopeptidase T) [Nocardioides exalbidus]|uniref:Leucyl aminopeptidase (Aminopeptidase T) n=1 Tax=Nocardioides exalbidus TaxID=402596 RepID=A0A1H5AIH2_9ACTN|nr:aminopeptidase [Nocardioides exalbidus]SED41601.1 Leucyl aminopeptidase (aminopeptidase T) [Nocardioides exalbidus]
MTEPFDHLLEKYARLVVRVGVNVQPGQEVVIGALPEQADAARAIAEEAYRVGASRVSIEYGDPHVTRAAVEHGPEEALGSVQEHQLVQARAWHETRPAMINLSGNPHPTLMDGLDPARLAKSAPIELIQELMPLTTTNKVAWTVVGAPTKGWADSVGVADLATLWDAVATSMRLDQADPVAAWQAHVAKLGARAAVLNGHRFDRIRYRGPGTDLTLGLTPQSRWVGGSVENAAGVEFVPNMPTEEVFVSPDWRRVEGHVQTSAPFFLASMGALVEDLALEISDGTITGATAARGEEAVRAQFELIPRSRHFGEVAIVDKDSAVATTGLVYKNMLFDENVGSHIAWGNGYTIGMDGSLDRTPEQRIDDGLNQSNTHVDIVIGSPEVQIDGIHADGSVVPVTRGDEFVLQD